MSVHSVNVQKYQRKQVGRGAFKMSFIKEVFSVNDVVFYVSFKEPKSI